MANQNKNYTPQLLMHMDDLSNLPEVKAPEGYTIRSFQIGEGEAWNKIINESFEKNDSNFDKEIAAHSNFKPERIWFACWGNEPVATTTAWYHSNWSEDVGYVHMVGGLKAHSGKGLGYQVSLAAMHQMVREGRKSAVLNTDDFRLPAIVTYLKLGFRAVIIHENQIERWKDIYRKIGREDLIKELPDKFEQA